MKKTGIVGLKYIFSALAICLFLTVTANCEASEQVFETEEDNVYTYEVIEYGGESVVRILDFDCQETEKQDVVIPRNINGYPVRVIGEYAFSGKKNLETVTVPEGVAELEAYAFAGTACTVKLPSTVAEIAQTAFDALSDETTGEDVSVVTVSAYESSSVNDSYSAYALNWLIEHNVPWSVRPYIVFENTEYGVLVRTKDETIENADITVEVTAITEGEYFDGLMSGSEYNDGIYYKVQLLKDGEPYEPEGTIDIQWSIPENMVGKMTSVYQVQDNAELTELTDSDYEPIDGSQSLYYEFRTVYGVQTGAYMIQGIHMFGDTDYDDAVTVDDALQVLKWYVKLDTYTEAEKITADVDNDGKITVDDALWILKNYVKIEGFDRFPAFIDVELKV